MPPRLEETALRRGLKDEGKRVAMHQQRKAIEPTVSDLSASICARRIYNTVAKHGGYAERAAFYRKMHADTWQSRFMFFYPPTALVRPLIARMQVAHVVEAAR